MLSSWAVASGCCSCYAAIAAHHVAVFLAPQPSVFHTIALNAAVLPGGFVCMRHKRVMASAARKGFLLG